jgi:GTPase involved in cell partitioning and DNA repair
MSRVAKLVALVMAVLALMVVVTACGDEQTPEEARQQLTTDLQAFEVTVTNLKSLSATSTVDEWKAAKEEAATAWTKVVESAAAVKDAEVGEVETAWNNLAKSIDDLDADATLQEAAPTLTDEITALKSAYDDLYNGLK